jgi:hypothetical protein
MLKLKEIEEVKVKMVERKESREWKGGDIMKNSTANA